MGERHRIHTGLPRRSPELLTPLRENHPAPVQSSSTAKERAQEEHRILGQLAIERERLAAAIGEEKHIAARIKELLRESFGSDVRIFVSSDYESIRSGSDWQVEIIAALKSSRVVLILCSADSVTRPWINYEAGVGDGTDWEVREVGRTSVFPLVVRNFSKGKVPLPLSRKHVRDAYDADDIKALLRDISEDIGIVASPVNVDKFVADMQEAMGQRDQVNQYRQKEAVSTGFA